jgi:hypothetical protein
VDALAENHVIDYVGCISLVKRPERVIERIADAMSATLAEFQDRTKPGSWESMRTEWDAGRAAVAL